MSLYFILLLASVAVPLALSFDKRLHFYSSWKFVFRAILIVAPLFIAFDIFLTQQGIWGFNPRHLSGITILYLPLEEWLFFVAIVFASLFLHYSIVEYFPQIKLSLKAAKWLSIILMAILIVAAFIFSDKIYTVYIFSKLALILLLSLVLDKSATIRSFLFTFLVILLPFIIVNGILTGSGIEEEVVWYNNEENLNIRFLTIPVEDFAYAFSLIFLNLLIVENSKKQIR